MHGYQLTFFTQQARQHDGLPLGEWLLQESRRLGIRGATLMAATQGYGHDGKLHAAHFFELNDQPIEVMMALSEADAKRIFNRLHEEGINIFFIKTPIEYGMSEEH
ncbi:MULTISPECIES: DUF190 domain-containing protein [Nitrosomonas]|jgi:PII-like signaling protein|uniref:PII-like signaling protein n=1 Tax=Nitrosomonas communis TaxID=44574 RepID=A0A0F7KFQ5_9PROT|nr:MULTISPECIES: DUF190 domain-containing protein [Nitrosomonas]AKH37694.1 hypothetical protein AAW31_07550 [Nitrosomonas communis]TYP80565.1 PII-like signaling protein [Nitrosomonas communis]UVS62996.1 DUF190 domain-containing protein [Nitrosomonas sp. PLL12]